MYVNVYTRHVLKVKANLLCTLTSSVPRTATSSDSRCVAVYVVKAIGGGVDVDVDAFLPHVVGDIAKANLPHLT